MVHRGRPSAACGPCRSRRLKCDQKKPFCSQCIRAKRECSGYRDVFAGRFYDQTEEVKRKNSPSSSPPSSSALSPPRKRRLDWSGLSDSLVQQHISVPLNDHGTAFVLARYLNRVGLNGARGTTASFLPGVLGSPSGRAMAASMNAVGLAALSNIHQSSELRLSARQEYISALAETNAMLSDQTMSTSDASLVAVTFLGLFELMTCDGPPLMEKYLKHVEGCAKLLQLRGSDQLKDPIGLALFSQFRMIIVLGNFWMKKRTPSWLLQLSHEALAHRDDGEAAEDELFLLMARVGDLCANLRNGAVIEPAQFVKKALKMDAELGAWATAVKPNHRYIIVNVSESANEVNGDSPFQPVHGNHYHIYPNTAVSSWWNDYRFVRLILLELICWLCDHLARKDEAAGVEYRQTIAHRTALSQQLTDDICASVPYHLGATEQSPCEDWTSDRSGSAVRLIWPLFVAADCTGTTPQTLDWIADTLFKIGYGVGVHQALVMSNFLRAGRHLLWLPELGG
ncbi:hypothetical protein BJX76DRAFT_338137 [Aspergillus varians]